MVGIFAGHADDDDHEDYDGDWFHTGVGSVTVGRYFTPHLKVEFDATATGTGTQFIQHYVTVPGVAARYPVGAEAEMSLRSLGAAATWQFYENEWVHPFVFAGLSADFDRSSLRVWQQHYYNGDPRVPGNQILIAEERREGPHTTTRMRGVVGGGAKLYVLEQVFVRADGRVSIGVARQYVAFRVGAGFDF